MKNLIALTGACLFSVAGVFQASAQQLPNFGFNDWKGTCGETGAVTKPLFGNISLTMRQRPGKYGYQPRSEMLRSPYFIHGSHQPVVSDQNGHRWSHQTVQCRRSPSAVAFISHVIMQKGGVVQQFGCRSDPETVFGQGPVGTGFSHQKRQQRTQLLSGMRQYHPVGGVEQIYVTVESGADAPVHFLPVFAAEFFYFTDIHLQIIRTGMPL